MSHVAVPKFMEPAETLMVAGGLNVTVAAQPVPEIVALAPDTNLRPDGSVSINAIPDCSGLPVEFVKRKFSRTDPPLAMDGAAKLLVSVGADGGFTTRH
jgi:hypothetical protein